MQDVGPSGFGRRQYFVDETGDPVLFNRRGETVFGKEGCSRFFMLGLLDVRDSRALDTDMGKLRATLLGDPYLKSVPSMNPKHRKTAIQFHAKDDAPEVREEVFKLLMRHDIRFYAAIRDKQAVATYVRQTNQQDHTYRYTHNELYEFLVRRLFSGRLHQNEYYRVVFSSRGSTDRTEALRQALVAARGDFEKVAGIAEQHARIEIVALPSSQSNALQATDYLLWALQRMYEQNDTRYWEFVWPKVRCVVDVDDTTRHPGGEFYTQKNPLTGTLRKK